MKFEERCILKYTELQFARRSHTTFSEQTCHRLCQFLRDRSDSKRGSTMLYRRGFGGWFIGILTAQLLGISPALAQNPMNFDVVNNRDETVYIYFANGVVDGTLPGSLGGGAIGSNINNSDSIGYAVAAHSTLSGFTINSFSGRVFVSAGETLESGNGSHFNNTSLADYHKRFDHFEMTFATNNPWGGANLTGTDFISMPLELNNGSSTVKWNQANFATALGNIMPAIKDQTTNQNGYAIVTGPHGINVPGIGNVVRVIAPSTADAVPGFSPFGDIGSYHEAMRDELIGNQIHVMSDKYGNDFNLAGSVDAQGDVVLTRQDGEGTIGSLALDSKFFTSKEIYKTNPYEATIDGVFKTSFTSNEAAAMRDIFAGFNLGVWGSTEEIDGIELGQMSSQQFFELGSTEYFFDAAQDNANFYNEYAALIAANSDNSVYGFPYSDVLGAQFISLNPGGNPTLTLALSADAVPEPSGLILIGGLATMTLLRRRRRNWITP